MLSAFGCDPIRSRIILLNKTTGDDRTDGIIVDGLHFGVLRFDMRSLSHVLDLSIEGAKVLAENTTSRTIVLRKASSHLSGKKIKADQILNFTEDIKKGDTVLIRCGNLIGFGISLLDHGHFNSSQDAVLRVKKLDGRKVSLNPRISSMQDIIEANKGHMGKISMDAANVIKGVASRREYRDLPVHVSFSGGKDSLVVLDLTMNALKGRDIRAFFEHRHRVSRNSGICATFLFR